jgi:hypothetical protein
VCVYKYIYICVYDLMMEGGHEKYSGKGTMFSSRPSLICKKAWCMMHGLSKRTGWQRQKVHSVSNILPKERSCSTLWIYLSFCSVFCVMVMYRTSDVRNCTVHACIHMIMYLSFYTIESLRKLKTLCHQLMFWEGASCYCTCIFAFSVDSVQHQLHSN